MLLSFPVVLLVFVTLFESRRCLSFPFSSSVILDESSYVPSLKSYSPAVDVTHVTHITHVQPPDIIVPPTEVVNVHHHHHHVVPVVATPIIQKIELPKIEIPKLNLPRLKNLSFNLKKTIEFEKRALLDEALAFKIGAGVGTVGGAVAGTVAGTAGGAVGATILHKATALTVKKIFGKYKVPVPVPVPIPLPKPLPLPLPLPLPIPILIPKLLSVSKHLGYDHGHHHHHRGDTSETSESEEKRPKKQKKIKIGGWYQHDPSNPDDKYESIQRDDDRRDLKGQESAEADEDEEEEEVTTPKPRPKKKKIVKKVKKIRTTTRKPVVQFSKGSKGFEITLG